MDLPFIKYLTVFIIVIAFLASSLGSAMCAHRVLDYSQSDEPSISPSERSEGLVAEGLKRYGDGKFVFKVSPPRGLIPRSFSLSVYLYLLGLDVYPYVGWEGLVVATFPEMVRLRDRLGYVVHATSREVYQVRRWFKDETRRAWESERLDDLFAESRGQLRDSTWIASERCFENLSANPVVTGYLTSSDLISNSLVLEGLTENLKQKGFEVLGVTVGELSTAVRFRLGEFSSLNTFKYLRVLAMGVGRTSIFSSARIEPISPEPRKH